ncbi:DUF4198 domain-containing protein [Sphingomonas aracearum]|uniref:DUF4198 domain-containing protein n=2 Tax=Sphingomonas aracearum TaxID=2283317 RepID=A0A369VUR6_9SPHN|nr:DUF4198 domain-containing protein [Sphingomonas aracearum]
MASADRSFIVPSSTILAGNSNTVTFDAAGADHLFFFDHRPIAPETIIVSKPDGSPADPVTPVRTRFRTVLDVRLDQQGTWKVASRQVMVSGTLRLNGEERRVGGRGGPPPGGAAMPAGAPAQGPRASAGPAPGAQAGAAGPDGPGGQRRQPPIALADIPAEATDVHLTEMVNTTETFVTLGAPTETVFKPSGKGLEFAPITHPNAIAAGETARFRFLIDGKPAAGVKVTVVQGGERYRDDVAAMDLVTGVDGAVAVKWPSAGLYWLGAEAEDKHPAEKRAEMRRMLYSATLEVQTP